MKFCKTVDALPHQQGAALFMALIMLLVLTILGVFGMNMSRLENLMAGNAQFQTTALNNAEYVLSRGVEDIQGIAKAGKAFPSGGTGLPYHDISETAVQPEKLIWSGFESKLVSLPDTNTVSGPDGTGKYVIVNAGIDNGEGEDASFGGVTNPLPGASVQVFLVTAQSESSRGAKRNVQSVVVTDPLAP